MTRKTEKTLPHPRPISARESHRYLKDGAAAACDKTPPDEKTACPRRMDMKTSPINESSLGYAVAVFILKNRTDDALREIDEAADNGGIPLPFSTRTLVGDYLRDLKAFQANVENLPEAENTAGGVFRAAWRVLVGSLPRKRYTELLRDSSAQGFPALHGKIESCQKIVEEKLDVVRLDAEKAFGLKLDGIHSARRDDKGLPKGKGESRFAGTSSGIYSIGKDGQTITVKVGEIPKTYKITSAKTWEHLDILFTAFFASSAELEKAWVDMPLQWTQSFRVNAATRFKNLCIESQVHRDENGDKKPHGRARLRSCVETQK